MVSDAADFTAQRNFIAAKIAAASAAAAAADAALADALDAFGAAFRGYFSAPAEEPRAQRRTLTQGQLIAASRACDAWWLIDVGETPLAIGFDNRLVAAAADFAICKRVTPPGDAAPTPVDRSIASTFARRLTGVGNEDGRETKVPTLSVAATSLEAALASIGAERWILLSLNARLPNGGGDFAVMIARAEAASTALAETAASPLTPERIAKVRDISVTAQCFGGFFEAPLGRVLALKPGDVVPIDWKGNGAAPLMLGGRTFATGTLGDNHGKRAIRL
ncbi:MAG TPA: hypothetical protein DDZ68_07895 [Parvularcula sp.]|nr:hypothetical protein [Parvularcula sp.]